MKKHLLIIVFLSVAQVYAQSKFVLPYNYSKIKDPNENKYLPTVLIPSKNITYIITDSIISKINEKDEFCFYFITPLESEINLQCPDQYGLIVLNNNGIEIYKSFWNLESKADLAGNCFPSMHRFKIANAYRNLLCMGSSGCGSGTSMTYYDLIFSNGKIKFIEAFSGGGGYSEFYFLPERNIYYKIEKVNPECHYSCPSKYKISSFFLSNDSPINNYFTKFKYDDFADIGIESLIKNIKMKEQLNLID